MKISLAAMIFIALFIAFGALTVTAATKADSRPVQPTEPIAKIELQVAATPTPTPTPTVTRVPKLEPVVPATFAPAPPSVLTVKEITARTSSLEIRANQPIADYKAIRMTHPERLVIDIACEKTNQKPRTIHINKFGITRVRIGVTPKNIRIVIDSGKDRFPKHTITTTENGLRINFK